MKIRDFFENCRYCYKVEIFIFREETQLDCREIYTGEDDFDNFINDYGDKEFEEWSVENNEDDTLIHFFLK